ncbi:MAG: hypothetical protein [Arizlama microvirus]|nr:MAG: hypothetical protein [Arizlama microvirus]
MGRNRNRNYRSQRRVTYDNANRRLPRRNTSGTRTRQTPSLTLFEDRRRFDPAGDFSPAKSFNKPRHRLTDVPVYENKNLNRVSTLPRFYEVVQPRPRKIKSKISFQQPDQVLICVRRNQRKEVLHALRKTGQSGQKKPRFNEYSSISCRRK